MTSSYSLSIGRDDGFVRRPQPGDALGAALRGAFGEMPRLPEEMRRLLRALDRTPTR